MTREHAQPFSLPTGGTGRLGIALSGGGLRAALFHIGVLARLADCDLLRHIEVVSTVSGGAIVGAFYYLKVKQLLEGRRPDGLAPSADAYRRLVEETEREFVAAVQRNIRLMTFADRRENARMLANATSPSHRLADLFDACFFEPLTGRAGSLLRDLPVRWASGREGDDTDAQPPAIPRLILNCAALNTGHLFQFAGSFVGEPSISSVHGGTSAMPRLERLRMDDGGLTTAQRERLDRITLGEAVAASCCVPGLLDPLTLRGLYTDDDGQDVAVRLVDGGVFDNQGLVSLFEEDCSHFIVSDASDPLDWQPEPSDRIHQVAMRANDVMMDRIRIDVMQQLLQREPGSYAVIALGGPAGSDVFGDDAAAFTRLLKAIRTDLDAFSDIEAASLMYHGYMASAEQVHVGADKAPASGKTDIEGSTWGFSAIEGVAADEGERRRVLRHLEVGSRPFLKVFFLGQALPWVIAIAPTLIPIAGAAILIYLLPPIPLAAWIVLGLMVLTAVALAQNARIVAWLDQVETFRRYRLRLAAALRPVGITTMLGMAGALASWINLRVFNPLFLKYGRLRPGDGSRSTDGDAPAR